jgi:hypothetical protein
MLDHAKQTGPAVEAHYQFLRWLALTVEKFPRNHKFTVGDRIGVLALEVLEALIDATYARDRQQHLRRANLGIEKLRFMLRLAADLRFPPPQGGREEFAALTNRVFTARGGSGRFLTQS